MGVVGAFALVLPVSVTASLVRGGPERAIEVSVAGPAPSRGVVTTTTITADAGAARVGAVADTGDQTLPPVGAPSFTTTTEVHRRVAAINGVLGPAPPGSVPPADDPIVERPTTTMAPLGSSSASSAATTVPTTTIPPAGDTLAVCPAELLQIDVVPTKATFAPGETVRGVNFIQTRTATGCLVPLPTSFRLEEVGTGRVLGTVAAATDYPNPVRAEAGKMYTSGFSWDPKDCSGTTCTQVAPGLYQAVAQWAGGVTYRGWGEFRIGT